MRECIHCKENFIPNPRVKNQQYCKKYECQRARRTKWQREKISSDPEYKENQSDSQRKWQEKHSKYWQEYRTKRPEYVKRNRILQSVRDARRRRNIMSRLLAKMDALKQVNTTYKLIPQGDYNLAKMDSFIVKLIPVKELAGVVY